MVDFTICNQNTLDLVLTSHPAFMARCNCLGAKSDHDIVLYDTTHELVRSRQTRRKILLWNNVHRDTTKQACLVLCQSFNDTFSTQWMICGLSSRQACSGYSTKTSSSRFTHPWISTKTLRLSRRKARAYHMVNFSNNIDDWGEYSLKDETQRKMRRDHQGHIQYTVNQDLRTNSKPFTPMSKARD